jgi:hypothetical protein
MRAALLFFLCVGMGCASKAPSKPAEVPAPSTQQELSTGSVASILRALSRSHEDMSQLFGPHQLTISVQSKLTKEKEVAVDLQEDYLLSVDKNGTVHTQSTNNQNEGFDAYLQKGTASISTRYGPLQPAPNEAVKRARDNTSAAVYANLEPLSAWLTFTLGEQKEVSGKKGLFFTLSKKDTTPPTNNALLPEKAWRATIEPELIAGELALEPQSGFLLFADISLRYSAIRNEQKILFEINIKAKLAAQGEAVAAIEVPEVEPLEPKLRLEKERQDLIGKAALQQQKDSKKKNPKPKALPTTSTSAPKPAPTPLKAPPASSPN